MIFVKEDVPKGWEVVQVDDDYHMKPSVDTIPHEPKCGCWCFPSYVESIGWVHHAGDEEEEEEDA